MVVVGGNVVALVGKLKQAHRTLAREMGTDAVTKADLKWYALALGPDGAAKFRFPTTWDLDDDSAYFQTLVLPRKQRRLTRAMWGMVHRGPPAPRKAGNSLELPEGSG